MSWKIIIDGYNKMEPKYQTDDVFFALGVPFLK